MASEDFYVKFGSNAKAFREGLQAESALIQQVITTLKNQAKEAGALGVAPRSPAPPSPAARRPALPPAGTPAGSGVVPATPRPADFAAQSKQISNLVSGLTNYVSTMEGIVGRMSTISVLMLEVSKKVKRKQANDNTAEAAEERTRRQPATRSTGEDGQRSGTFAKKGSKGSKVDVPYDIFDVPQGTAPSIRSIPQSDLDAAVLSRLLESSKSTAKNTGKTNDKLDALIRVVNSQESKPAPAGGKSAPATSTRPAQGGTPAATRGDDDPAIVGQLRRQIQKRRRLEALEASISRMDAGGSGRPSDQGELKTLIGRSKSFNKVGMAENFTGDKYRGRVNAAITSVRAELQGVPTLKQLEKQLVTALERFPDSERAQRRAAAPATPAPGAPAAAGAGSTGQVKAEAKRVKETEDQRRARLTNDLNLAKAGVGNANATIAALQLAIDETKKQGKDEKPLTAAQDAARASLVKAERMQQKYERLLAGKSRADVKKENRAQAGAERAAAPPRTSKQDARDRLDLLETAGSTATLDKLTVPQLQRIRKEFERQGYAVTPAKGPSGRPTKGTTVEALSNTFQRYDQNNRATAEDLQTRAGNAKSYKVSPEAAAAIKNIVKQMVKSAQDVVDDALLTADRKGGGSGVGKGRRGKTDIAYGSGTSLGDREMLQGFGLNVDLDAFRTGRGGVSAAGVTRGQVDAAEKRRREKDALARVAARDEVRRRSQTDVGFNPFAPSFNIPSGGGEKGQNERRAVSALRREQTVMDALGRAALEASDKLAKFTANQEKLTRVSAAATRLSNKPKLNQEEGKKLADLLVEERRLKAQVAKDQEQAPIVKGQLRQFFKGYTTPDGRSVPGLEERSGGRMRRDTFATPEYRAALADRDKARKELVEARERAANARAERAFPGRDSRESFNDAMFGRQNSVGVGAGGVRGRQGAISGIRRTASSSPLPDIRNEAAIREQYPDYDRAALKKANSALAQRNRAEAKRERMLVENREDKDFGRTPRNSPEALKAAQLKVDQLTSSLIDKIEKATKSTYATATTPEGNRFISRATVQDAKQKDLQEEKAQRAKAQRRIRDDIAAGRNLENPNSVLATLEKKSAGRGDTKFEGEVRRSEQALRSFSTKLEQARRGAEAVGKTFNAEKFTEAYVQNRPDKFNFRKLESVASSSSEFALAQKSFAKGNELSRQAEIIRSQDKSSLSTGRVAELAAQAKELDRRASNARAKGVGQLAANPEAFQEAAKNLTTAEQIGRARELLAKAGVRWSETLNASLNQAKSVKDLMERLQAMLQAGTVKFSEYKGPGSAATPATGRDSYRLSNTGFAAPAPIAPLGKNASAFERAFHVAETKRRAELGQAGQVHGPGAQSARDSAAVFLDAIKRAVLTPGGTVIGDRDVPKAGRRATAEPKVLEKTYEQLFGQQPVVVPPISKNASPFEKAFHRAEAALAAERAAAVKGQGNIRRAETILQGGEATKDLGLVKGKLAKQAGLNYQEVKGQFPGLEGLRGLLDIVQGKTRAATKDDKAKVKDAVAQGKSKGFDDDCCTKIVAALNEIKAALRSGLKVTTAAVAGTSPDAAQAAANAGGRRPLAPANISQAAADRVRGLLPKDLQQQIKTDPVAAGTRIVTEGYADRIKTVQFLRRELDLTEKKAKDLDQALRDSAAGQRLVQSVEKGATRAQKRAALQEADESRSAKKQSADKAVADSKTRDDTRTYESAAKSLTLLSEKTQQYVRDLAALSRAGASASQIVAAQKRVYDSAATDLIAANPAGTRGSRRSQISDVLTVAQGQKVNKNEASRIGAEFEDAVAKGARNQAQANAGQAEGMLELLFGGRGFASRVLSSFGTFIVRNFSAGLVFGVTNALQDALKQGLETQSTFVRVSDSLESTGKSSAGLRTELQGLSQDYGVALKDVYTTAAGLTGVVESVGELTALTEVAVQLQSISGGALNATEAVRTLSGITSAFADVTPEHIADVATVIQNRLSVNIEDSIEAASRLSGQAVELGLSLEQIQVYGSAIGKFTGQTGTAAGEQFSRILAALQTGRGSTAVASGLQTVGIDVTTQLAQRDYSTVLETLLENYQDLDNASKTKIALALGGQRQAAAVAGLLREGKKVNQVVDEAETNVGAASSRSLAITEQLAQRMQRLGAAFQNFAGQLVQLGLLNAFAVGLVLVDKALTGVNHALAFFSDLADSSGLFNMLLKIATTFGGIAIAINLARKAYTGFLVALAGTSVAARFLPAAAGTAGAVGAVGAAGAAGAAPTRAAQRAAGRAALGASLASFATNRRESAALRQDPSRFATQRYNFGAPVPAGGRGFFGSYGTTSPVLAASRGGMAVPAVVPLTARGRFFARRAMNFETGANRASQFGQRMALASQNARIVASVGPGAMIGQRALAAGAGTASIAARSAGAAMGRVGAAMAALSRFGPLLGASLLGVAVVGALAVNEMQKSKRAKEDEIAAYKKAFERPKPKSNADGLDDTVNPFAALVEKQQKDLGSFSGYVSAATSGLINYLSFGTKGQSTDERAGIVPDAVSDKISDRTTTAFRNIRSAESVEEVQTAIDKEVALIEELGKNIQNDSSLSTAQKNNALLPLVELRKKIQGSGSKLLLAAQGMNQLNALTIDQLNAVAPLINSINTLSPSVVDKFSSSLMDSVNAISFQRGSDYEANFASLLGLPLPDRPIPTLIRKQGVPFERTPNYELNNPFVLPEKVLESKTSADRRQRSIAVLKKAAEVAQTGYAAFGADQTSEAAVKAREASLKAVIDLNTFIESDLTKTISDAQAYLTASRNSGNFAEAIRAADVVIATATKRRDELDPSDVFGRAFYDNQINEATRQRAEDTAAPEVRRGNRVELGTRSAKKILQGKIDGAAALVNALEPAGNQKALDDAEKALRDLNNQMSDLLRGEASSGIDLEIAIAEAAGNRTAVAELVLKKARADYQAALDLNDGDVNAVGSRTAQIGVVNAEASQRDITLQSSLDTLDFNREIGTTTAAAGIGIVQRLLQTAGLTEAQERSLLLKLKGLEADALQTTLSTLDFNMAIGNVSATAGIATLQDILKQKGLTEEQQRSLLLQIKGLEEQVFNETVATIDFNLEIGDITANSAIASLQELLKQTNLSEEQRRTLRLKIKGLQADIRDALTSSGFNIPNEINLPTAFEVRRSLGIDPYIQAGNAALQDIANTRSQLGSQSNASAFTNASPAAQISALSAGSSSSSTANITVNNTVSSPAMVEAVARRVVELISSQTGTSVRSNQTSPALVRY